MKSVKEKKVKILKENKKERRMEETTGDGERKMKIELKRTQETKQTGRKSKISKTVYGPENNKNGNIGEEDQKVYDKPQGTKESQEIRKQLFGEKEGEKMDVTKVIQEAKDRQVPCNSMEQSGQ